MNNFEQLIRIGAYMAGSALFGQAFASGDMYQQAVGAVVNLGAFGWWLYANKKAKK